MRAQWTTAASLLECSFPPNHLITKDLPNVLPDSRPNGWKRWYTLYNLQSLLPLGVGKMSGQKLRFGVLEADLLTRELRKHGLKVKLADQPFQFLAMLLERPGQVVTREELQKKLWPNDVFVDFDQGLNKAVNKLRDALNDPAGTPRFIETLPRRGYRFIAPVLQVDADAKEPVAKDAKLRRPVHTRRTLLAILGSLVLVAGMSLAFYRLKRTRPPISSLAVLPLSLEGKSPELEYLSDGMTENIINNLSQLQRLRVMARGTVFHYKGRDADARTVGRELGVSAVLTGRVLQMGDEIIVSTELTDVSDGSQLWGKQFRSKTRNAQTLQDEIVTTIAAKVLTLTSDETRILTRHPTADPEAYRLYLLGRFYWNKRTTQGLEKAAEYFEQAMQHDLNYGPAYAGLADAYGQLAWEDYPPRDYMPRAKAMATRALQLDEQMAEAHTSLAMIHALYDWDWEGAELEFRRAIELNPGYATAHHWYAVHLGAMARLEESRKEMARALEIDPLSLIINLNSAYPIYYSRQYDIAIAMYRKTIELDPNFSFAHEDLMIAYERQGNFDAAMQEAVKALNLSGDQETARAVDRAFHESGHKAALRMWLRTLQERSRKQYVSPMRIAQLYVRLSEKDEAFQWLQKAIAERSQPLVYLNADPLYDPIRSDPRFAGLLTQIGIK